MIIECTTGQTRIVILSYPYRFELDEWDRAVCEVHEDRHIECFLANPIYREATRVPDEAELEDLARRHERYEARFFPDRANDNDINADPKTKPKKPDRVALPTRPRPGRKPRHSV